MTEEEERRQRRRIRYEEMENEVIELLKAHGIEASPSGIYSIYDNGDSYEVSIDQTITLKKS